MNPVPNADNRCSVSRPRQRSRAIRPPPRAVQLRPNVQWAEDAVDKQQPLTVAPIVEKEHSACAPPGRSRRQCATHAREAPELLIPRGGVAVSTGVLEGAQCTRELVSGGAALTGGQPGADRLGRQRIVP